MVSVTDLIRHCHTI